MPNTPLQTFRTVEPANYGFGSSATLASRPFVLSWIRTSTFTSSGAATGTVTNTASTATTTTTLGWNDGGPTTTVSGTPPTQVNPLLNADRCLPWVARSMEHIYPVKVPNAYDRIYIFPMYCIEARAGASISATMAGAYLGSSAIPFGLIPETRGYTTTGKADPLLSRLPDDLLDPFIAANPIEPSGAAAVSSLPSTRTNGLWTTLPPYSANFTTSNASNGNSESAPSHIARSTSTANGKLGAAYNFPVDISISKANTGAMTAANVQVATGPVIVGLGLEFQILGCEEIVLSPVVGPGSFNWTVATAGDKFRLHWFMMGVFLG